MRRFAYVQTPQAVSFGALLVVTHNEFAAFPTSEAVVLMLDLSGDLDPALALFLLLPVHGFLVLLCLSFSCGSLLKVDGKY